MSKGVQKSNVSLNEGKYSEIQFIMYTTKIPPLLLSKLSEHKFIKDLNTSCKAQENCF